MKYASTLLAVLLMTGLFGVPALFADDGGDYNAWCEIVPCYQSTKSAKARLGRPSCSLSQMQKLCSAIFAAKRA